MAKTAKPANKSTKPKPSANKVKTKTTAARKKPTAVLNITTMVKDILAQLKKLGDEKMRKFNAGRGVGDNQFGVKLGDVRNVAKKIKPNHELAMALWKTGNFEAQLVATLIIQAKDLSAAEMESLVKSVKAVQLAEWLHSYVTREHPDKETLRQKWMNTKDPMAARAGWRLTAGRVARNPEGLDIEALLQRIEREMGTADPLIQWTMNTCLAEIGINFPKLRERAIAIGEKLGIYRDYPCSPGCTSPFAPIWINEMVKRQGTGQKVYSSQ